MSQCKVAVEASSAYTAVLLWAEMVVGMSPVW